MLDPLGRRRQTQRPVRRRSKPGLALACLDERGRCIVKYHGAEGFSVVEVKDAELGLANARRVFQHGLEHGLEVARRARDDLQHLGGRGLPLQRLAQLVEQPRVLDGDDGLAGEILTSSICLSVNGVPLGDRLK